MMSDRSAVLLLAHGTPETVYDVPEFLRLVTGGRQLPESVIEEVKHRYAAIGRSPLLDMTRRQSELLQGAIKRPVYIGMRNWKPFIADTVKKMVADGVQSVVVICLAPQNSRTSVGLYRDAVLSAIASTKITIHFVESWHDHPGLIRAFAEKLRAAWKIVCSATNEKVAVIFTAHSVPARTIQQGDPYESQARTTAELVHQSVPELAVTTCKFAFQSQGMPREPWIGPTVEDTLLELKHTGHRAVLIQPIGFVCDHIEVLYDIDIVFKKFAAENGIELFRTESLNDSPHLTAALADLATRSMTRRNFVYQGTILGEAK
jgi:protoporphyrin/coproporphyrin ferrochelatase